MSLVQELSGIEVFEVFMISKDHNIPGCTHQKMWLFLIAVNYHHELLIVNIIVEFGRQETLVIV